ncbi:MAG: ATP synthase subunit I [Eubacteriales bacterium]|nr:ATP synthase subunit I [Eubacteriales bacterium]MDD4476378.1 ATP synthase subunit I [Eubacteriales bacterium]
MKISPFAKRMIISILIIALASVLISIIYYRSLDFLPFLYGVVLGSAVSIAKIFLLEHTVNKAIDLEKHKASSYVTVQYILRLVVTGVVLYLGAVVPQINLLGVVIGILAFQAAVYITKLKQKS